MPQRPKNHRPPARPQINRLKLLIWVAVLVGLAWSGRSLMASKTTARVWRPTKAQSICLDPGHGGIDVGAVNGKSTEKDLNLHVALAVRDRLRDRGYQTYLTRTIDRTLINADRYNFCNRNHATILVSIHHNDFADSIVDHTTALYYKTPDKALATKLAETTANSLTLENVGVSEFESGVLSKSTMPATIIEAYFLTNNSEAALVRAASSQRLNHEADGITAGIVDYFAPTSNPAKTP